MQSDAGPRAVLEHFLSRPSVTSEGLSYGELRGFMFALVCAPDLVKPSEWLPMIFGGEEPEFEDLAEAQEVMEALMGLYNLTLSDVRSGAKGAAAECAFREEVLANLEPDAPVAEWARGFRFGHQWLEETWEEYLLEEWEDEFAAQLATLVFFSSRELAVAIADDFSAPDATLESVASMFRRLFPAAIRGYAAMGVSIWEALQEVEPERPASAVAMPGRNEPCPCGSGRKFKKCCGRLVH